MSHFSFLFFLLVPHSSPRPEPPLLTKPIPPQVVFAGTLFYPNHGRWILLGCFYFPSGLACFFSLFSALLLFHLCASVPCLVVSVPSSVAPAERLVVPVFARQQLMSSCSASNLQCSGIFAASLYPISSRIPRGYSDPCQSEPSIIVCILLFS